MITIEKAVEKDISMLSNLLAILFTQEEDFVPNHEKQKQGLMEILNKPEMGKILVLKKDSHIIGMVNLLFTISTALGGKVAILEDMIVAPEHRSNGEGSLLLAEAISFAQNNACKRITLLTDNVNEKATRFYERHGFRQSAMKPLRLVFEK